MSTLVIKLTQTVLYVVTFLFHTANKLQTLQWHSVVTVTEITQCITFAKHR